MTLHTGPCVCVYDASPKVGEGAAQKTRIARQSAVCEESRRAGRSDLSFSLFCMGAKLHTHTTLSLHECAQCVCTNSGVCA